MSQTWGSNVTDTSTVNDAIYQNEDRTESLRSMHSGASDPSNTVAHMVSVNTTEKLVKQRNSTDDNWIKIGDLEHEDAGATATTYWGLQRALWKTKGNCTGATTIDWSDASAQHITLTGNVTLTFSNPRMGEVLTLIVEQEAADNHTVAFAASTVWTAGGAGYTATATNAAVDVLQFIYDPVNSRYHLIGLYQDMQ